MAVVFSDNFDVGLTGWSLIPSGSGGTLAIGCSGTKCLTCNSQTALGPRKYFATLQLTSSFRFYFAYLKGAAAPFVGYLLQLFDTGGTHFLLSLLVNPNGSIELFSAETRTSTAGLVPTDGTWVAIQITASMYTQSGGPFPGTTLDNAGDFQIVVNNSVVWNPTGVVLSPNNYSISPVPTGWDGCQIMGYVAIGGVWPNQTQTITAIDNFEVEDVVTVTTFNLCPGTINPYPDMCSGAPPPTDNNLTVVKASSPTSGSTAFPFTTIGGLVPPSFSLLEGQSQVYTDIEPGIYSVLETSIPAPWTPAYSLSTGGTDNLNISIEETSHITLTVTNTMVGDIGGMYFINPTKATKHDSYYNSVEKKIPNPTIKTALIGD